MQASGNHNGFDEGHGVMKKNYKRIQRTHTQLADVLDENKVSSKMVNLNFKIKTYVGK